MHHVVTLADLAAKALAKQVSDIGFVVHDKNAGAHAAAPVPVCESRGRRMMNSVNSPTRLSTSIVPPCCCVTMSYAIERPSPVPSPVGLVVTNGWNSLSL